MVMRFVGLEHVPTRVIPRFEIDRAKKAAAAAAEASGASGPLVYLGAGISSLVFCDERERAYKAARSDDATLRDLFDEETAWLKDAQGAAIRPHVAKLYKYHPELVVIERECVKGGTPRSSLQADSSRDVYDKIVAAMKPKGWGPPEYKPDSFVMHESRGPVLVDAGFASRFGENYLRRVKERLAELKRLRKMTGDDAAWRAFLGERFLQDSAWALRMEVLDKRLTAAQADPVLEQLYALGAPRDNPRQRVFVYEITSRDENGDVVRHFLCDDCAASTDDFLTPLKRRPASGMSCDRCGQDAPGMQDNPHSPDALDILERKFPISISRWNFDVRPLLGDDEDDYFGYLAPPGVEVKALPGERVFPVTRNLGVDDVIDMLEGGYDSQTAIFTPAPIPADRVIEFGLYPDYWALPAFLLEILNGEDTVTLLSTRDKDRGVLIHRDTYPATERTHKGKTLEYRVTFFDKHGPSGHHNGDFEELLREALNSGYRTLSPGGMDALITEPIDWS